MKPLCRLFAASTLSLLAVSAYAQAGVPAAEPGTGSTQVKPASAAPETSSQPNLRTDSMPHTNQDATTDSAPAPETLGMDATPIIDMGLDWSLPQTSTEPAVLKKIVTSKKGQVSVVEVQTLPVMPLPVINPPLPPVVTILDIPRPGVTLKPTPQDPLSGIPQ
jgi:hypothetical protein